MKAIITIEGPQFDVKAIHASIASALEAQNLSVDALSRSFAYVHVAVVVDPQDGTDNVERAADRLFNAHGESAMIPAIKELRRWHEDAFGVPLRLKPAHDAMKAARDRARARATLGI